ncbi:MAG: ATP-binding protein [Candidatus Hydrothermarchaeaceae archaeon]
MINEIKPAADSRKITIKTQLGEPLPSINASFCEFGHAFYNILENAVKFNETSGEVTVKVRSDEEFVEISVEDTGIGISKEHLCRIFETFYQVDSSTTRKYKGTGMGLAVTKDIIEAHGGKITIDSKLSDGTTVTFNVPVFR